MTPSLKLLLSYVAFVALMIFMVVKGIPTMVYWTMYSPMSDKELEEQNAACVASKGELIVDRVTHGKYMGKVYDARCRFDELFERYTDVVDTP